jgi:TPP-dependent trihydroxycyclohexane-1,2-dione (THcHDO) dehydratase
MSKIAITVEFTEAEFRKMVKDADCKITDEALFLKVVHSKEFAENLAADLKQVWEETNEDSYDLESVLSCMGFDECVEESEFE